MQPNPYRQYQTTQISTASTGELVLLLYDGAIRCLGMAELALEERSMDAANRNLYQAQEVVLELYAGLDYQQGGELAANLARLYLYIYRTLVQANLKKDIEKVREIRGLLDQLRAAWRVAVQGAPALAGQDGRLIAGGMAA